MASERKTIMTMIMMTITIRTTIITITMKSKSKKVSWNESGTNCRDNLIRNVFVVVVVVVGMHLCLYG